MGSKLSGLTLLLLLLAAYLFAGEGEKTKAERLAWAEREQRACAVFEKVAAVTGAKPPDTTNCGATFPTDCDGGVPLLLTLEAKGETTALRQFLEFVDEDCHAEYEFALTYGKEAWVAHRKIMADLEQKQRDMELDAQDAYSRR